MSGEIDIIRGVRDGIVAKACGEELNSIKDLTSKVLLRMSAISRKEDMEDMETNDLFYFSKTLEVVTKVAKTLIDIERDSPEKKDDALTDLMRRISSGNRL